MKHLLFLACLLSYHLFGISQPRKVKSTTSATSQQMDAALLGGVKYRLIGPFRGGRSAAVTGSLQSRNTFYFGATGGGVWKTTDGGSNWKNISDGYFGSSIGAIAVAPSNENIIYVGEGENTMRGNVSEGLGGIWKSIDGGKTWKNCGLKEGRHITNILVDPTDPSIVWAGVMGHLFGPNTERGVLNRPMVDKLGSVHFL